MYRKIKNKKFIFNLSIIFWYNPSRKLCEEKMYIPFKDKDFVPKFKSVHLLFLESKQILFQRKFYTFNIQIKISKIRCTENE